MGGVVTKEESIAHAQYLDLVYSQYDTFYELIPNYPRPSTDPSKPSSTAHADGVIDSIKTQSSSQSTDTPNHSVISPTTGLNSLSSSTLSQVSKVNSIQYDSAQQSGGGIKLRINLRKKIIKPKMKKHKHNHLLLRRNLNTNQNFHVSFVVNITTHDIVLIRSKLQNFLKKNLNPLY
jgi:hypothetical protein